jgi:hypothetical protein
MPLSDEAKQRLQIVSTLCPPVVLSIIWLIKSDDAVVRGYGAQNILCGALYTVAGVFGALCCMAGCFFVTFTFFDFGLWLFAIGLCIAANLCFWLSVVLFVIGQITRVPDNGLLLCFKSSNFER